MTDRFIKILVICVMVFMALIIMAVVSIPFILLNHFL